MEVSPSRSDTVSNQTTSHILLRRPRPPKAPRLTLTNIPSSEDSTSLSRNDSVSNRSNSKRSPSGVTFSEQSRKTQSTNRHHQSLPAKSEDSCRTEIQEMLQQSAFMVNPIYPRGPEFFPPGKVLRADTITTATAVDFLPDEIHLLQLGPSFTFNDLQLPAPSHPPTIEISKGAVSRQNYLKLTGWFATHVPSQENVNMLELEVDHKAPANRVPQRQILAELQAMINKVVKDSISGSTDSSTTSLGGPQWPPPAPDDALFRSATSRYFCGQARSNSPFNADHQPLISPAEVAILESMMSGGSHLSLKAQFINQLPALQPLAHTLTSLNLSYNSLKRFPAEILELQSLLFLSLRNNPLKEIPDEIGVLQHLRYLCLSFCNLAQLPVGLFDLVNLIDLDVSYNNLSSIPREFHKLRNLCKLNIEGNRLTGLPATALSVPLGHIILGNNLMHPLLWKENTSNDPPMLVDLCCIVLRKSVEDCQTLPEEVQETINKRSHEKLKCDECQDSILGQGLQVIRGVEHKHFKVKNLPFIFIVCSPTCGSLLKHKPAKFWLEL